MRKRMIQVFIAVVAVYALLALYVMLRQRSMIYFPTRLQENVAIAVAAEEELEPWRNDRGELIGWCIKTNSATTAVLVIHGNAGFAGQRGYIARPIHAATAADVYVLEFPGYGARHGLPTKQSILAAADEALAALARYSSVYVVSESLGAGAAAHLAARHPARIAGLVMFVPFDKLSSVAQHQMPILPASWLLWDRFAPADSLLHYRGPAVFVVAAADSVIPAKFGQRLHSMYRGPKKLEVVPDAGHNDVAEKSPDWWKQTLAFCDEHTAAPPSK